MEFSKRKKQCLGLGTVLGSCTMLIIIVVIIVVQVTKGSGSGEGCKGCMAVASDNNVCTEIGADVLKRDGSAVDSAIAVLLCLGAVQPQSNGLGGGGFMLVHTKTVQDKVINFRERAPAAATEDMYVNDKAKAQDGGLAVGVPGEIRGYWAAHQLYGNLEWQSLFQPSIKILKEGITVTAHMEGALEYVKAKLIKNSNAKEIFFKSDDPDSYLREGETFTNPKLAAAYQKIADGDYKAFYTGTIAENIIKAVKESGGIMEMSDLDDYEHTIDKPLQLSYRGRKLITCPPPASGHVISIILQILENFELGEYDKTTAWNHIIEAMRYGFAVRSKTGDLLFSDITESVVERVRKGTLATELLASNIEVNSETGYITPFTNINQYSNPVYLNYDGNHATHVTILGPGGQAVAVTSTVNLYFGSRVMTDDGIILNNEMDDFSTPGLTNAYGYAPSPENFIVPKKRPMSSSSPTIVYDKDGEAIFATGAAGGPRIITGTLLSLINALDWKMSLIENVKQPRIHDQLNQETLYETDLEEKHVDPISPELVTELSGIGYNMTKRTRVMSIVTSVSKLKGFTEAQGDPRKAGTGIVIPLEDAL